MVGSLRKVTGKVVTQEVALFVQLIDQPSRGVEPLRDPSESTVVGRGCQSRDVLGSPGDWPDSRSEASVRSAGVRLVGDHPKPSVSRLLGSKIGEMADCCQGNGGIWSRKRGVSEVRVSIPSVESLTSFFLTFRQNSEC